MVLILSFGRSLTCPSGKPLRLSFKLKRRGDELPASGCAYDRGGAKRQAMHAVAPARATLIDLRPTESVADYDPLWNGWGPGARWGGGWGGRRWGWGWGGWGPWGPEMTTITQYSGQVLANLQGPSGFMRCDFRLMRPSTGMGGGGA